MTRISLGWIAHSFVAPTGNALHVSVVKFCSVAGAGSLLRRSGCLPVRLVQLAMQLCQPGGAGVVKVRQGALAQFLGWGVWRILPLSRLSVKLP